MRMPAAAGGFDRATWNTGQNITDLVGGGIEGQKQFYDQLLPARANKLLKALGGGEVGTTEIGHSVKITPELRKAILKGLPLLSVPAGAALMTALQGNQP